MGAAQSELPASTKVIVSSHDYEQTASEAELRALVEVSRWGREAPIAHAELGCLAGSWCVVCMTLRPTLPCCRRHCTALRYPSVCAAVPRRGR